jgi:hypothetical protein
MIFVSKRRRERLSASGRETHKVKNLDLDATLRGWFFARVVMRGWKWPASNAVHHRRMKSQQCIPQNRALCTRHVHHTFNRALRRRPTSQTSHVYGLGIGDWGLGFRVFLHSGADPPQKCLTFRVYGLWSMVWGLRSRVWGLGFLCIPALTNLKNVFRHVVLCVSPSHRFEFWHDFRQVISSSH